MKKKAAAAVLSAVMALSIPAVSNAALDTREISIVPIAAYTAQGNEQALKKALVEGLNNGMTVNEIKEVLVQMYAYTAFPRSLTGLGVFVNLLKERKASGINDKVGRGPTPLPEGTNIRELGTKVQTELIGRPAASPVYDFSPEIDKSICSAIFLPVVYSIIKREKLQPFLPSLIAGSCAITFSSQCLSECRIDSGRIERIREGVA